MEAATRVAGAATEGTRVEEGTQVAVVGMSGEAELHMETTAGLGEAIGVLLNLHRFQVDAIAPIRILGINTPARFTKAHEIINAQLCDRCLCDRRRPFRARCIVDISPIAF